MAATARRRDPDDDIAAIAKQISDQAEAIYQNWKSRGLGPADLISCHAAGDSSKLGSMLKPTSPSPQISPPPSKPPSIDLLAQAPTMDNNRLEKLVKTFVDEDKARLAAARGGAGITKGASVQSVVGGGAGGGMPSSIQHALRKFERGAEEQQVAALKSPGTVPGRKYGTGAIAGHNSTMQPQLVKPIIAQKPQISPKPRLGDTIEMTLPADLSTCQTWPLKNRLISTETVKKNSEVNNYGSGCGSSQPQHKQAVPNDITNHVGGALRQAAPSANSVGFGSGVGTNRSAVSMALSAIDKQVALEEKRLINALKNGDVVDEAVPSNRMGVSSPRLSPLTKDVSQLSPKPYQPITTKQFEPPPSTATLTSTATTTTSTTSMTLNPAPNKWAVRGLSQRRPLEQQVPHPELTTTQRQHMRQAAAALANSANPVRPFLTRGSVAERVLIFERCPSDLLLDKRARAPTAQISKIQPLPKQPALQHTTLQRHVRAHRNVNIPRFHFPVGKPGPPGHIEIIRTKVTAAFTKIGERASREHFAAITQACQLPLYCKTPLYLAACADKSSCTLDQFMNFWQSMTSQCHDASSRFIYILTRGRRTVLSPEDFIPLVQDVVETHPGLTFLKEATEFHSRYVHTVIARIYYCVNRSWSGKITIPELRRSNLLSIIQLLEEEEDINQITQYFSYEHFYVIYCKFWELDRDHDLFIDKQDLTRHNDHALSSRIIDRIFCGCVTRGKKQHDNEKMSYTDFVWFLLSEEDKTHPTAIEYWFRCMDLDGDGYLSMYELEYFYEEQMHRMEAIGIETLPFQDCLCQMLDMVKPNIPGKISLSDLRRCKMTPIFFDTFFNLEKYLDHEQRDPFASQRDHDIDGQEMSDWERYAAEEYELLVAEEGGNDNQDSLSYDEGNEEDLLSQHVDGMLDDDEAELTDNSDDCSI